MMFHFKRKQSDAAKPQMPSKAPAAQAKAKRRETTALDWEASRLSLIEKSESTAWRVVKILSVVCLGLVVAIVVMMPLKQTEPFVIQVDKSTGMSTVLAIANERDIPADEMMDKFWLGQYVLSRESYDYRTLENDFIKTRELSMPSVFDPYASQFGLSKNSMEQQLGDTKRIVVELQSVVPNGNGIGTVRFTKKRIDTATGQVEATNNWTATVGYEYVPDFKVEEAKRLINPFGFKVTTYRVDAELL